MDQGHTTGSRTTWILTFFFCYDQSARIVLRGGIQIRSLFFLSEKKFKLETDAKNVEIIRDCSNHLEVSNSCNSYLGRAHTQSK